MGGWGGLGVTATRPTKEQDGHELDRNRQDEEMPGRAGMQAHAGRQPWHAGSSSGQIAWRHTRTHTRAGRAATGTVSYGIGPGELQSAWDLRGRNTSCAGTWARSGVHAGAQFSKQAPGFALASRLAGEKQKTQGRLRSGGTHRHGSKGRSSRCQQHQPDCCRARCSPLRREHPLDLMPRTSS